MKSRKAVSLYELIVPQNQSATSNFFISSRELYFQSEEEALLYQEHFFPQSKTHPKKRLAVIEEDSNSSKRWILITKKEDMNNPNVNKQSRPYYHCDRLSYKTTSTLENVIAMNPESVIAVKECDNKILFDSKCGGLDSWTETTSITYDATDSIDQNTRYLYVTGKERWFVKPEHSVTLTDATYLKLQHDLLIIRCKSEELAREKGKYLQAYQKKQEALQQKNLVEECQQYQPVSFKF